MRTYKGTKVDVESMKDTGFNGTVTEEEFEIDDDLRAASLSDGQKYYPDEFDAKDLPVEEEEVVAKRHYVPSPTFSEKMLRADEILQDRYDELKNYALKFKKVKSRISKKFDSINKGRLQFVKLSIAGKTLKLYLNMNINETEPKFHCKDMSAKKTYVVVPTLLRIKSGRAVKYAKMLIDQCAAKYGLVENPKFTEVDAIALVKEFQAKKDEAKRLAAEQAQQAEAEAQANA